MEDELRPPEIGEEDGVMMEGQVWYLMVALAGRDLLLN